MKLPTLLISSVMLAATAHADMYASGTAGTCIVDRNNIEVEGCQLFTGTLGYQLTDTIIIEAQYTALNGEITGLNGASNSFGDYDRKDITIGANYNFYEIGASNFYAGGRVGHGVIGTEFSGTVDNQPDIAVFADDEVNAFLYGAVLGADWPVTSNVELFAEISYTQYLDNGFDARFRTASGVTGELSPGGVMGEDRSYDIKLGIRVYFD